MSESWSKKEPRMYSAGYRGGQRLAAVPFERLRKERSADPYFIALGYNVYHEGFEDGWHGRVPRFAPLLLSDLDNDLMGAK